MSESTISRRARNDSAKDLRRQHILDCAEKIVLHKGLSQLSITAVAKEAKLAIGTIYLYFENKEELIAQLTLKSREILLQKFREGIALSPHPLEQIRNILVASQNFYQENKFYHELVSFFEINAGLAETPELKEAGLAITHLVVSVLENAKKQGLIRPETDEKAFALIMWATSVGMIQLLDVKEAMVRELLPGKGQDFYNHYVDILLRGIMS
ncbi:MAG: TetR/AcrR family transcriptional regulator [Microscillaceae bacterium]|nr:TetR/AcrR family transcriptional regulator [Microscillaceae bacterium]